MRTFFPLIRKSAKPLAALAALITANSAPSMLDKAKSQLRDYNIRNAQGPLATILAEPQSKDTTASIAEKLTATLEQATGQPVKNVNLRFGSITIGSDNLDAAQEQQLSTALSETLCEVNKSLPQKNQLQRFYLSRTASHIVSRPEMKHISQVVNLPGANTDLPTGRNMVTGGNVIPRIYCKKDKCFYYLFGKRRFGLAAFGGATNYGETPLAAGFRELDEEVDIIINGKTIKFVDPDGKLKFDAVEMGNIVFSRNYFVDGSGHSPAQNTLALTTIDVTVDSMSEVSVNVKASEIGNPTWVKEGDLATVFAGKTKGGGALLRHFLFQSPQKQAASKVVCHAPGVYGTEYPGFAPNKP